ncbi:hypothetical protein BKA18_000947 [Streptomyces auratus]
MSAPGQATVMWWAPASRANCIPWSSIALPNPSRR